MSASRTPEEAVLALVQVINGDSPRAAAEQILDPSVRIHMDSASHRGISIWYKWIHLIRNCGHVSQLRMTGCKTQIDGQDPRLVHLTVCWVGRRGSERSIATANSDARLRYLVENGRISEIWTRKANYEFIFGRWIKYSPCYRLFLAWAVVYFAVHAIRGKNLLADAT